MFDDIKTNHAGVRKKNQQKRNLTKVIPIINIMPSLVVTHTHGHVFGL